MAASSARLAGGLPLWEGDAAVFAFVRGYSAEFRVVGASVLGRIRSGGTRALHVIVEVQSLGEMQAALASAPFTGIYSHDNTLTFSLKNVDVTIENLLPADFAARLVAMGKRAGNVFAHDALIFNPQTQELSDPFHARGSTLKIVNKTLGGASALDAALRGTVEAAELGLASGTDFALWRSRVLQQIAKAADAQKLAATFLQQLVALADGLPTASVARFLRSRLVSTALRQVFYMDVEEVIATYGVSKQWAVHSPSDAARWLAALLPSEIAGNDADGAATTWLQHGTRFQVLRSRRALVQAQAILQG